jgi:hypothetical protein
LSSKKEEMGDITGFLKINGRKQGTDLFLNGFVTTVR